MMLWTIEISITFVMTHKWHYRHGAVAARQCCCHLAYQGSVHATLLLVKSRVAIFILMKLCESMCRSMQERFICAYKYTG